MVKNIYKVIKKYHLKLKSNNEIKNKINNIKKPNKSKRIITKQMIFFTIFNII
jgi:hypothetical protein